MQALLIRWMYFDTDQNAPSDAATAGHVIAGIDYEN